MCDVVADQNEKKIENLQREVTAMKKQKAEISKKMREEAKQWDRFKEEQRNVVKQLRAKVDQGLRAVEEAKSKERCVCVCVVWF